MDACTNPDILRVIWFFKLIVNIVKIIIPIALIILGIIDFSKSMITNDENAQKKSGKLFAKRILYAILVFTIPWLIEVFMVTLGNLMGEEGSVNFTDCIENANGTMIEKLENNTCGDGLPFTINYFDDNNNKIESIIACNDEYIKFDKIIKKGACENNAWEVKGITGLIFDVNMKTNINYIYDIVKDNRGFDLIPVWEGIPFTIDYYKEDGTTLIKSVEACTNTTTQMGTNYYKEGYNVIGWNTDNSFKISQFKEKTEYIFSESDYNKLVQDDGSIKLIAAVEKITIENCNADKNIVKFYDETGNNVIKEIEFCNDQLITFPSYNVSGRDFKGWDFKYNSTGETKYYGDRNYSFNDAQMHSIYKNHGDAFHLIPVFD